MFSPRPEFARIFRHATAGCFVGGLGVAFIAGCGHDAPTTQPTSVTERQNAALHDPFNYGSDMQNTDMRVTGKGEYDSKKMNRDLNDVLNP